MRKRILALTIFFGVSGAQAQDNPLVGNWLNTSMDPRGITNTATAVTVQPNGVMFVQMSVSGTGGSGQQTLKLSYEMTGENSYATRVTDYEPKIIPPMVPLGTMSNCQFTVTNNVVLMVSCDGQQPPTSYTRQ